MKREHWVEDYGLEGEVLDPEYYDEAIVGVSTDGRAIYDWDKVIDITMVEEQISEANAIDWHEYNTLKSLPYLENPPVLVHFNKLFKTELLETQEEEPEEEDLCF